MRVGWDVTTDPEDVRNEIISSAELLARTQALSHVGSWVLDLATNRLSWSDETYRLFGEIPQSFEATYEAFLALCHPDDRALVDAAYSGSLARNQDAYEIEHRIIRPRSGEVRYVAERCDHIRDESGQIVQSVGMTQDITERKRMELTLRAEREEYARLFSSMISGFAEHEVVLDAQGRPVDYRFLAVNPAFEEQTGLARSEVVGRRVTEVMPGLEREWIERYGRVAITGVPDQFVLHTEGLGKSFQVQAYCSGPGRFAVTFTDITAMEEAREQLAASEERYRSYVENAPLAIFRVNAQGQYVEANPAACALTGYSREELLGLCVTDIAANPEESRRRFAQLAATGRLSAEASHTTRGGHVAHWRLESVALSDGSYLCFASDTSLAHEARKALEAARQRQRRFSDHLQRSIEAEREQIARHVHDELGQSLAAIKMALAECRKGGAAPAQDANLRYALSLVDGTLGAVKRLCGDLRPSLLSHLGLSAALEHESEQMEQRTGLQFHVHLEELQPLSDSVNIALFRIFKESVTNILKHAQATSVTVRLREWLGRIELTVRDDGVGITPAQIQGSASFGIMGMIERAESVGGGLSVAVDPRGGTIVVARIPAVKS
jgi:PAS domain S-box-containing protein